MKGDGMEIINWLREFNIWTALIRLALAFILAGAVGFEREKKGHAAGLRTHILVCMGAALTTLTGIFCAETLGLGSDPMRIGAQVVSGIGFLGAGVILRNGSKIKGLNTAATLWCVASIGVLSACGMLIEATVGTFLVLLSNILLRLFSLAMMNKVKQMQKEKCILRISCKNDIEVVVRTSLAKSLEMHDLSLQSLERNEITKKEVKLKAIIITGRPNIVEEIVKNVSAEPGVTSISFEHKKQIETDSQDSDNDDSEE